MKKKVLSIMLATVMVCSLAACGNSSGEKAPELPIKIHGVDETGNLTEIPDVPEENREKFGVVVVSERTPLQYDGAGEALAPEEADWKSYRPVEWREGGEDR